MVTARWSLWILALLCAGITKASAAGASDNERIGRRPVVLIPGFASTQLQAWRKHSCDYTIQKNLYRDVNVGDRIWIDVARILAQGDCWVRCMKLNIVNQTEVECKLRAGDGLDAIGELDPGLLTGPLSTIWRTLVKDLVEHFEFEPHEIVVAPYDWRLPPSMLQERDKYFISLKRKIEHAIAMDGGGVGGVVVIAHSMGNNVFRYFLAWLKHEVGRNNWQKWIDKHISTYFALGAPLLGSSEALELLTSGITQGLPLPQSEVRKLVVTFGSILSFLPMPSIPPTSHDSDVLVSVRYPPSTSSSGDGVTAQTTPIVRNYTSGDISSGVFFRDMAAHDPIFGDLEKVRQRFYVEDDVLEAFSPWERPPIASVYAVYGTNLETKYNYRYHDTDIAGHWYQVALENEQGHHQVCSKTGDGTVPYHSLSWAHTWLGANGAPVNVTRAPQSVYFSSKQIKKFNANRQGDKHHADYIHDEQQQRLCDTSEGRSKAPGATTRTSLFDGIFGGRWTTDHVTFYENTRQEHGRDFTTSVWEVEGARHREILSNSAFLRELRTELRHIFKGQAAGADKSARPPVVDSDCYWNYRQAKCEFPEFCQYRYVFGDVTLDQSCRVRLHGPVKIEQPPPKGSSPRSSLLNVGHRNAGVTTSRCVESTACSNINGTPLEMTLPYEPWDEEDRMTALMPPGMPGYCLVPCEYCLYPTSRRRGYAH